MPLFYIVLSTISEIFFKRIPPFEQFSFVSLRKPLGIINPFASLCFLCWVFRMLTAAAAICAMHNLHPALSDERKGEKIASAQRRKDSASSWPHCGFGGLETSRS